MLSIGKGIEQLGLSYTSGGRTNWCNKFGKFFGNNY